MGAVVFLAALGLRLSYLRGISGTPLTDVLLIDSETYDRFARLILAGAFRGEDVYAVNVLYPYFLAGIYAVAGCSLLAVLVVQAVLDALSCLLTWWIARRLLGASVALASGLAVAAYGAMIFYAGALLTPTLIGVLGLAAIACLVRYQERPRWPWALAAGLLLGLATLGRGNNLLFALASLVVFRVAAGAWKRALGHWLVLLAGSLLLVGAATARNYLVEGKFVPISANYAAFYIGHNPDANGLYTMPSFLASADFEQEVWGTREAVSKLAGRQLTVAESAGWLFREGLRFAAGHPGAELRLALVKLHAFLNRTEAPTNLNYYFARDYSPLLRALPLSFGIVAPLAGLGILWTWADRRRLAALHLYLGVACLTCLLFFFAAEYRLPAVPVAVMFAAAAAVKLVRSMARLSHGATAERRRLLQALLLLPPLALVCNLRTPLLAAQGLKRVDYYNFGTLYRLRGDYEKARAMFGRALAIDPRFAPALSGMAELSREAGDFVEAARLAREAGRQAGTDDRGGGPAPSAGLIDSALVYTEMYQQGDHAGALVGFERLRRRAEAAGDSLGALSLANNVGLCLYKLADYPRAARRLELIIAGHPDYLLARKNLARVYSAQGRVPEAIAQLERAVAIAPGDRTAQAALAELRARQQSPR